MANTPIDGQQRPALPETHFIDNRIYLDEEIFAAEQATILGQCWRFVLHETELPNNGDFRLVNVGGREVVILRGEDGDIRGFLNTCAHRGARLLRQSAGHLEHPRMTCFYHHWSYDTHGRCVAIPESAAYDNQGVERESVSLSKVRIATMCGLVFACLDAEAPALADYLGPEMTAHIESPFGAADLEVFHFHRSEIAANWKLFVETNCEGYHEFLHVLNRTTGIAQDKYRERRWHCYTGGHAALEEATIGYERLDFETRESSSLPGMHPNGHVVVDVFPDLMLNCRSTVVRIDSLIPISPERTVLECRGLGSKVDTDEIRDMRIRHHNQVWGPTGTNLAEDVWAVEAQMANMRSGTSRYSIIAREEQGSMDDEPMRHFYAHWAARTGRKAHDLAA